MNPNEIAQLSDDEILEWYETNIGLLFGQMIEVARLRTIPPRDLLPIFASLRSKCIKTIKYLENEQKDIIAKR